VLYSFVIAIIYEYKTNPEDFEMKNLCIVSLVFSIFAVLTTFSNTEYGRSFAVYDYELVSSEYKLVKKNGGDERSFKHIFNRKNKIGGIKSLYISLFNIDGYKKYSTDYQDFVENIS